MANLLKETLEILLANGKGPNDVLWVGTKYSDWQKDSVAASGSWADFEKLADFEYDDGFGGDEITTRLYVVGKDWWLERGRHDGSGWWEFKTLPQPIHDAVPLRVEDILEYLTLYEDPKQ